MRGFGLQRLLMPAMVALAALCITETASYFTDRADQPSALLETARLSFAEGGRVTAALSEADDHVEPFREGESFTVRFSAVYDGSVDAAVISRLGLTIDNMTDGDVIRISDGMDTRDIIRPSAELYAAPEIVAPGTGVERSYTITIVQCAGDQLNFRYDFSLAAAQQSINPELSEDPDRKAAYEKIRTGEGIRGFRLVTDPDAVSTPAGSRANKKTWAVLLNAHVVDGNSASTYHWYEKYPNEEEKEINNSNKSYLNRNLSEKQNGIRIRYEVENEAGYVRSEAFTLSISDTAVEAKRSAI